MTSPWLHSSSVAELKLKFLIYIPVFSFLLLPSNALRPLPPLTPSTPAKRCLVVSLSLWVVCRVLTPWPGVAPLPLQWKCGVLPLDLQGLSILPVLFLQLHVNFSEQVPLQSWGLTVYTSISFWTWGLVVTLPFCVSDFDLVILWLWISVFFLIKQRCGEWSVVVDFFF